MSYREGERERERGREREREREGERERERDIFCSIVFLEYQKRIEMKKLIEKVSRILMRKLIF